MEKWLGKKIIGMGLGLLVVLTLGVGTAQAGFGVSPSNIYHEYLKPGGHFEQKITISRSEAPDDLEIVVEPSLEEMREWFRFDPGMTFIFPKGQQRMTFTAIIDVPKDALYKKYEGVLRVKAMGAGGPAGGVAIVKGARVDVELLTTEINVSALEVTQMKMRDVVGGETLKLDVKANNKGNVDVHPEARLTIMNLQMQPLEELEDLEFGSVGPNKTEELTAEFETKLGTGEYFGEASIMLDGVSVRRERLVFRIMDREAIGEVREMGRWAKIRKLVAEKNLPIRVAMGIVAMGLLLMLVMERKKLGRWLLPIVKAKRYLAVKLLATGLILTGIGVGAWYLWTQSQVSEGALAPTPTASPAIESSGEEVSTSGEIQGVTMTYEAEAVSQPLIVTTAEKEKVYPLYREPSSSSQIVFYAHEGDDFSVVEERAEWYRIVLPDATGGWLAKESVKSTTIEER